MPANGRSATPLRIVVVGSSFAGLTAALELRRKRLDERHEVVVLDPQQRFTFIPSLIWVPFGLREINDISFELEPLYDSKGIRFINEAATQLDAKHQTITTAGGEQLDYDRLMLATGPRLAFEKVPGLGPEGGFTQSVCTSEHALLARHAWQHFLENPGPAIVGTAQGGSCFGASYEFLLNLHHQIQKAGLQDRAPVTFITAEPFIGHLGLGGVGDSQQRMERYLQKLGIDGLPNSAIKEVCDGEIELHSGRVLPFAYSMIVPPFTGVDLIRNAPGLANAMGFIPITDEYNHPEHPEIYAAGVDIAIAPPGRTPVPAGVPPGGPRADRHRRSTCRRRTRAARPALEP